MDELNLNEYERIRRQKMEALRAKGIEPFGSAYKPTHHSAEILTQYHDKTKEELSEINQAVVIAGRIMTKREMGKAGFMHLLVLPCCWQLPCCSSVLFFRYGSICNSVCAIQGKSP